MLVLFLQKKTTSSDLLAFLESTDDKLKMMLKNTEAKDKDGFKDILHNWAKKLAKNPLLEMKKDVPHDNSDKKKNVQEKLDIHFVTTSAKSAQV